MGRYDSSMAVAERSIALYGEAIQIIRTTETQDPTKPWLPGDPVDTVQNTRAVFLNFPDRGGDGSGQRFFNNTLIETNDKKVLIAGKPLEFAPLAGDRIVREDSTIWTIANSKVLDPNGQKILYTLQVRQ